PVGLVGAGLIARWVVPLLGWQYMFAIGAIPALLILFMQRQLPESPRWLASRGRDAEAEAALSTIERETERALRKPLPPVQVTATEVDRPASWADLFGPKYLRRTLVVWVIWFAAYL